VFVATMTGTAEALAEDLQAEFSPKLSVEIRLLEDAQPIAAQSVPLALFVSSTYGTGEVPETAEAFYRALCSDRPDLGGMRYGVISLGDRSYADTFARGGVLWDEVLTACGARRVGEMLSLDSRSSDQLAAAAILWVDRWLQAVEACRP